MTLNQKVPSTSPDLEVLIVESAVVLRLNRPHKRNALSSELNFALANAFDTVVPGLDVRSVILTGAGAGFCAGGDLGAFPPTGSTRDAIRRFAIDGMAPFLKLADCPLPVIAAVHGPALGAGCELAMACDFVVADHTARFGLPETGLGVVPAAALLFGFNRVSRPTLEQMVLLGRELDAPTAKQAGLVDETTEPGQHLEAALRLAARIASRDGAALRLARAYFPQPSPEAYERAIATIVEAVTSADARGRLARSADPGKKSRDV